MSAKSEGHVATLPIRINLYWGIPVMDVPCTGVFYTIRGMPYVRPAEADQWELVPGLAVTCLFDWQRQEEYRGFASHPPAR